MTTIREWINEDPRRRAPEFDFGTHWTREHDAHTEWAVTYNTGTGEVYARNRNGDDVEVLGQFADPQDVAEALPDWGRRARQAGSLDWVQREMLAQTNATRDVHHGDPIYGIALGVDSGAIALREPQSIDDVRARLGNDLDVSIVNTGDRTDRVIMWVDDLGHDKHLCVNAAATQLYGTGWPILGDAVVVSDDQHPLPPELVRSLVADLDDSSPDLANGPDYTALDWDDHLRDRERSDVELGIDDDLGIRTTTETLAMGDDNDSEHARPQLTPEQEQNLLDRLNSGDLQPPVTPTDIVDDIRAWANEQNSADVDAWFASQYPTHDPDVDDGTDIDL